MHREMAFKVPAPREDPCVHHIEADSISLKQSHVVMPCALFFKMAII